MLEIWDLNYLGFSRPEGEVWVVANALSGAPGEYGRKAETQRNWRGNAQAVERVV